VRVLYNITSTIQSARPGLPNRRLGPHCTYRIDQLTVLSDRSASRRASLPPEGSQSPAAGPLLRQDDTEATSGPEGRGGAEQHCVLALVVTSRDQVGAMRWRWVMAREPSVSLMPASS